MPDDDTAAKVNAEKNHGGHRIRKINHVSLYLRDSSLSVLWRILMGAAAGILMIAPKADAGLNVCNKANVAATVAVAQPAPSGWQSRGWWTILPGQCRTVIGTPLTTRYYYVYATDGGAGNWSGKYAFCTERAKAFTVGGRGRCGARGFDSKGFFEIDTTGRSDWKQTLTD